MKGSPASTTFSRGSRARHRSRAEARRQLAEAGDLGAHLGRTGATVKTLDLLVATYALAHGLPLLTGDSDFKQMKRAGVPLLLV